MKRNARLFLPPSVVAEWIRERDRIERPAEARKPPAVVHELAGGCRLYRPQFGRPRAGDRDR